MNVRGHLPFSELVHVAAEVMVGDSRGSFWVITSSALSHYFKGMMGFSLQRNEILHGLGQKILDCVIFLDSSWFKRIHIMYL